MVSGITKEDQCEFKKLNIRAFNDTEHFVRKIIENHRQAVSKEFPSHTYLSTY